jgi:uncharacterized membrane protein
VSAALVVNHNARWSLIHTIFDTGFVFPAMPVINTRLLLNKLTPLFIGMAYLLVIIAAAAYYNISITPLHTQANQKLRNNAFTLSIIV